MAREGPLRGVWRRGVAMREVTKGRSLILAWFGPPVQILPQQQQTSQLSSASTACSTILSSHFQPCRRVRLHSSHTMRHFASSCQGDARALKEQRPWPKEKFKDTFNFYPTQEPKRIIDVESFNRPFDESHRLQGSYPSLVTQLPTALEPQFPSASVDQSKTWDLNALGNLDQSTSSSTLKVVPPGSKASSKPVPTIGTISEHRRSRRAEKSTFDQRAQSPKSGRPGPRFETSYSLGKQHLPRSSNRISSSNSNPNYSKQIEAGGESEIVIFNQTERRSPGSCARLSSNSHATQMSYGKSGTRVEPAYIAVDQARSSQNGAHPAIDNYRIPATRIVGSVIRQTSGNASTHMHSAGTTSEAIAVLQNRLQRGIATDSYTYVKVLQMCLKQKDLLAAKQVDDCIIQSGMDKNPYVANTLLNVYIKCGGLLDARRVFDELENKSVINWNSMIAGYSRNDHTESALELFKLMRQDGARPNEVTYLCILKACASPLALTWGKQVHECVRHAGFESDVRVGTALLQMYAKCGCVTEARRVFENLTNRNIIAWNIMIGAYAERGHGMDAYRLFLEMRREGFKPNVITYVNILNASASAGALEWLKEVHSHASKAGLELDLRVGTALVHMYAKSGSIDEARLVFDRMEKRDVVTWNVMIGGLSQYGCRHEAYRLFRQIRREGLEPDAFTYVSILNASASAGALEWVKEVHGHASKAGLESGLRVGNALIHMYAESGSIDDARRVFDRMEKRDVFTWNVLIGGLAHHGCGQEALTLFRKMTVDRVKPDEFSFVAVLSACCHSGLVDEGRRLFSVMTQDYGIEPNIMHYTCMVDLLGRAGHLEEAKLFISDMPIEPNGVTWTALLGACRTYGNEELGELAAKELFKLEPYKDSTYVLLSNIYAAAGKWEKVSLVRTMMQKRSIRKEPGCSRIEVDNKIHEFVVGDTSHPEAKAIYTELNKLTEKLKAEGYIPDTRLVLHDTNEEDRDLALCSHSETLAIAFGLMHIPRGEPILVRKNLRVCPDCHTATKFISKVTGREIIARDAIRFHHFKDGVCSCGDYW